MFIRNEKGFTLAEIIVGMGLMSVMGLGFMAMTKNMHKGQATAETKMEELELRRIIATTLTDKTACQNTLVGKNIGNQITQIKNSAGAILFEKDKAYGNNSLKIANLVTKDQSQVFSDGTRAVNLVVTFQKMKSIVSQNVKSADISLRVKAPSSTGALSAPSFTAVTTTSDKFCTGANYKGINELALSNQACPNGQAQVGIAANGSVTCSSPAAGKLAAPTVTEGSACVASEGNIAVNAAGALLSYQSGSYAKQSVTYSNITSNPTKVGVLNV